MNTTFKNKVTAWLNAHNNGTYDFDGAYGAQCVDLVQFFNREVVGGSPFWGNAKDLAGQIQGGKYRWQPNLASTVPGAGWITVWNGNMGGGYGHTSICTGEADTTFFVSLDQNWNRPAATYVRHNYNNVIGFLVPVASEVPDTPPTPAFNDNQGVVQGDHLWTHTDPNTTSSKPWYFDDQEVITLLARTQGETVVGKWGATNWWYQVEPSPGLKVWVSDGYVQTKANPAGVPDYSAPAPTQTPTPITQRPTQGKLIVDVSSFQGDIDFTLLKPDVDGVVIRAGHVGPVEVGGLNRTDVKFHQNQAGARAAGIPVAYYWYIFLSDDPKVEAQRCVNSIGQLQDGEAIFLDLEEKPDAGFDLDTFADTFLTEVERLTGRVAHGYSYKSYLNNYPVVALTKGERLLWEANYNNRPGEDIRVATVMHQYWNQGHVNGIAGNVDLSVLLHGMSLTDFDIRIPLSPPQPTPTTNPTPTPADPANGEVNLPVPSDNYLALLINKIFAALVNFVRAHWKR